MFFYMARARARFRLWFRCIPFFFLFLACFAAFHKLNSFIRSLYYFHLRNTTHFKKYIPPTCLICLSALTSQFYLLPFLSVTRKKRWRQWYCIYTRRDSRRRPFLLQTAKCFCSAFAQYKVLDSRAQVVHIFVEDNIFCCSNLIQHVVK